MWNGALSLTLKLTCLTKIYRTNLYGTIYIYIYNNILWMNIICSTMYLQTDWQMVLSKIDKWLVLQLTLK